ncbi:hypothetical protein E1A91_A08G055500v1 [Gossypium mustelinum]|uniref:Uncharacterized protein n=1 Tax=Gossypium mustelinum TaxID=34275 RepID=A0A5D2Y4M5_GOSMU|nr:hypothetical protein E1A91_A08G055500v1 [Gossypium mustelinum]
MGILKTGSKTEGPIVKMTHFNLENNAAVSCFFIKRILFTLSLSLCLWSPRVRFTSVPAAISGGRRCDNGLFSPCLNTPKGPPF